MSQSYSLLSRKKEKLPEFVEKTGFASETHFIDTVSMRLSLRQGLGWENYGSAWQIEHRIPRCAYDFDNEEDVRRCWSDSNIDTKTPMENGEKWIRLVNSEIKKVNVESYPISWNGRVPTGEEKEAFYKQMMAKKVPLPTSTL